MSLRIQRVNELLKEEISQLLLREVDFDKCLVTVTEVDTAANLSQAKVKISVMPQLKSEAVLKRLRKNVYHLQQQLNHKLNMRPVPKIIFVFDKTSAEAQRVEDLLLKIKKDGKADPAP